MSRRHRHIHLEPCELILSASVNFAFQSELLDGKWNHHKTVRVRLIHEAVYTEVQPDMKIY